jgi:CubicO group peptidase (beta-lactamase class C family)
MKFAHPCIVWALATLIAVQAQTFYPWESRHRLTSAQYQTTFTDLVNQGYRLNYVSGYTINNQPQFVAIWEKRPSPPWAARHGMTSNDYQIAMDGYVNDGFRPVLVNGYAAVNGDVNFVAIWEKSPNPPGWVARHGMSSADYQKEFDLWTQQGYRLTHVSGYAQGAEARYAAIWELRNDGIEWIAYHGMTEATYGNTVSTLSVRGFRLVDVSGYEVNGNIYYAAIWEHSTAFSTNVFDLTSEVYVGENTNLKYQGYVPTVVSGYTSSNSDRYAAIWINNFIKQTDMVTIDAAIKTHMDTYSIPGLSLAIMKDDRLVFAKGFGYADTQLNIRVNPDHLFRIASLSKPITAATIMKLTEGPGKKFSIDDQLFGTDKVLDHFFGYNDTVKYIRVQHLLEHSSGWAAKDLNAAPGLGQLSQHDLISYAIRNIPLNNGPPGTKADYLNFGYLILGRLIEAVTGFGYETYVKTNILSKCGITRMKIAQGDMQRYPDEVNYYPSYGDSKIPLYDSFGGWVGTPIDLMRFVAHIDGIPGKPDIILPTTLSTMYTRSFVPNSPFAKGWLIDPRFFWHNGILTGMGSFLARKTNGKNLAFAVITNKNVPQDTSSGVLATVVDRICDTVSSWPSYDLF